MGLGFQVQLSWPGCPPSSLQPTTTVTWTLHLLRDAAGSGDSSGGVSMGTAVQCLEKEVQTVEHDPPQLFAVAFALSTCRKAEAGCEKIFDHYTSHAADYRIRSHFRGRWSDL